jgi:hypothetical protein
MNSQEFTMWLKGFLDAITQIETHHISKIKDTLDKVSDIPVYPIAPNVSNEKLVPYHTICSCNPANGGGGICGCTMGNKLVPNNSKSNIYTTTSDNIKFNWQYKETDKQLLHD